MIKIKNWTINDNQWPSVLNTHSDQVYNILIEELGKNIPVKAEILILVFLSHCFPTLS